MSMKGILVAIVTACAVSGVPDSHGNNASERGRTLGTTLLEVIQLQAKTRMWDRPSCDEYPLPPEVKEVCSALNRFSDLLLEFGEDPQDGVASQELYDLTVEYHLLAALEEGISDKDAFIRCWTLAQLEIFCRGPFVSRAGQSHCRAESERSALRVLSEDASHLNRHLALQILASG